MSPLPLFDFDEAEMEAFITEAYNQNFSLLRLESGVALSPEVKQAGLQQVLYYWRMMREVALNVTDTEVRLSLPRQETPKEREYGIEGIVDIVRDEDTTYMYDIKTHNVDYVRSHVDLYEDQLNVYAHIWAQLGNPMLDGTAVICTEFPIAVKEAMKNGNEAALERAIEAWDPLVTIDFDRRRVEETIREFGKVVDQIEDHEFAPPPVELLQAPFAGGSRLRFGTHVCRNCDVRFSCDSYRKYVRHGRGAGETNFLRYYQQLETGESLEVWRTAGLDELGDVEEMV